MPRRGENIYHRKDGLWEARYTKGLDEFGKKKMGSVYGHSYKEAKEKRLDILSQISLIPQASSKRSITLSALVQEWLYVNQSRIKLSTYQKYNNFFKNHIANQIGKYQIIYLSPIAIKQYTDIKLKEGLSPTTINNILVFVHTCMKYGNRQYGLPLFDMIYLKQSKREMRVLSLDEQRQLTNYLMLNTDIYKLGVLVALYTGMRIGELCALKWGDIQDGVITINKTMQRLQAINGGTSQVIVGEPKSASSMRRIPLPTYISELVETFRLSDDRNFMSRLYHPIIEPRVLQYQFKKQLKDCNIKNANFHALRHTFATRCVECEIDVKTLSELLGHSDVSVTLNKYVHSSFEQKQLSINKLKLIV